MCSGICPRSSAARSRILTLSLMCFWPTYSSQRVGRRVWSKYTSLPLGVFSRFDLSGVFVFFLDIDLKICYTVCRVDLSTPFPLSTPHYSTCVLEGHSKMGGSGVLLSSPTKVGLRQKVGGINL